MSPLHYARNGGAKFVIEYDAGSFEATRNGRAFGYNYDSIEAAVAAIKRSKRYVAGDKITAYDEHGIRTLIRY